MFSLNGTVRAIDRQSYTNKDGVLGEKIYLIVEPVGRYVSERVKVNDLSMPLPKVGDLVQLPVNAYAYTIKDKKRQPAYLDLYIPKE